MREINLMLDFYSIVVSLILIIYLWINGRRESRTNHFFILMCLFNLGMLAGDMTNWTCEGFSRPWFPFALRFGTVLYFGCSAPLLLAFTGYVNAYLPPVAALRKNVWNTACILTGIQLLFSILSLWTGMYFKITSANLYKRGDAFWISQLIPVLIYTMTLFLIVRHRKYLRLKDTLFMTGNILLPLAAEIIQIMNYGLALMNTGSTLALLLIFINIQSERELLMQKQENALAESRIDMLMSQIYPHFLYNMLAVIRQLCSCDPAQAKEAIEELSLFLRANMESLTNKNPIPLKQELAHVQQYLNLEQKRFGKRLHVIYDITASDFLIPPLTLQPIAENAVRHGIMKREEGGAITICTKETQEGFHVIIKDNGPGADRERFEKRYDGHGIGIENVRKRLILTCGGSMEIHSEPGTGTTVAITIPKK